MRVLVKIPAPLRVYVASQKEIEIEFDGNTLKDVLSKLTELYPDLRNRLFEDSGNVRKFLTVFINNINARDFGGENAKVKEGDIITILPAIAGGYKLFS